MLSSKKLDNNMIKVLPTIDIVNPYSLTCNFFYFINLILISYMLAWSILRRVLLDYGKSFYLRL